MTVALVAGAVANKAGNAGAAWTRLSWAGGLAEMGFDVHLVEQLAPGAPVGAEAWFVHVTQSLGFDGRATLLRADGTTAVGRSLAELVELAAETALLVNISGHLTHPEVVDRPATRVFVDLDPGYTQLWHAEGTSPLAPHDHWYTVGSLVGTPRCPLPVAGIEWRPTHQPVVRAEWPTRSLPGTEPRRFTTVGSWRGAFGTVSFAGESLGPKAHELRRFVALPRLVPDAVLELALEIHDADHRDRDALDSHGWRVRDPLDVVPDPYAFRSYVQGSTAELSVAQGVYVRATTGWFSDRTVRYLASGRPAVVQDTGFTATLPTGEGLLAFDDLDGAVRAVEAVLADPDRHAAAAAALADELFAAPVVLGRMCEEVGVAP
jgi:hypothetical protein